MARKNHIKPTDPKSALKKFSLLLIILTGYYFFISFKYGFGDGFLITMATWSFFVLCTPIADAGILIDFPLRLLFHVKMIFIEMLVWTTAISLNLYLYFYSPEVYDTTIILSLFKQILENPIPFWSIIILSAFGTFLSIRFGDEILDIFKHNNRKKYKKSHYKWKLALIIFVFILIIIVYFFLLKKLGINNIF